MRMLMRRASTDRVIVLLDTLLTHTVPVRDLYKSACCQAAHGHSPHLRPLLDTHYEHQLRLVDVLVYRICALGGTRRALPPTAMRGYVTHDRLLCGLLDAHEFVLHAAQTTEPNSVQTDTSPYCDFAVGRLVLTNDLQRDAVRTALLRL